MDRDLRDTLDAALKLIAALTQERSNLQRQLGFLTSKCDTLQVHLNIVQDHSDDLAERLLKAQQHTDRIIDSIAEHAPEGMVDSNGKVIRADDTVSVVGNAALLYPKPGKVVGFEYAYDASQNYVEVSFAGAPCRAFKTDQLVVIPATTQIVEEPSLAQEELEHYTSQTDVWEIDDNAPTDIPIKIGDWVEIVSGSAYQGKRGRVEMIDKMVRVDFGDDEPISFAPDELKLVPSLHRGNRIKVIKEGHLHGEEGYVCGIGTLVYVVLDDDPQRTEVFAFNEVALVEQPAPTLFQVGDTVQVRNISLDGAWLSGKQGKVVALAPNARFSILVRLDKGQDEVSFMPEELQLVSRSIQE